MFAVAASEERNYFNLSPEWVKKIEACGTVVQVLVPCSTAAYCLMMQDYSGLAYLGVYLIVNQLVIEILKRVISETRPNGHRGSFPSGHTMATAFGAAFLIKRYTGNAPGVLALASCVSVVGVGASRVIAKAHWIHDVIAGAFFGSIIGCLVPSL
ncbi:MAG: phosphatase PAP2 family protein [Chlamydiales bacterium]|nr:phosphatase PAP2 family protein [Chlamydiales bacterium]